MGCLAQIKISRADKGSFNVWPVIHNSGHVSWKAQAWLVAFDHRNPENGRKTLKAATLSGWKQPSVPQSEWQKGRQTDTPSYCKYDFILLYSFSVLTTAIMCIPAPYLLPTFVYKVKIYYWNNKDDAESNKEGYSKYCISIVYVTDLYWLFTTVEQKSYPEAYCLLIVFVSCS